MLVYDLLVYVFSRYRRVMVEIFHFKHILHYCLPLFYIKIPDNNFTMKIFPFVQYLAAIYNVDCFITIYLLLR